VLGNTLHRMPQIVPSSRPSVAPSGFVAMGSTPPVAGNIIARAIDEGDDTWKLFLPFELVWAGGAVGRLAGQAYYSWVAGARAAPGPTIPARGRNIAEPEAPGCERERLRALSAQGQQAQQRSQGPSGSRTA